MKDAEQGKYREGTGEMKNLTGITSFRTRTRLVDEATPANSKKGLCGFAGFGERPVPCYVTS